jgi:hypothetical protein
VLLTAGELKPRTETWKGSRRKAPDTPAMDVKKDIVQAISGGIKGDNSMSATGKYIR